jgi:pimeloyl-ACP methyl ester carboxylesterase
MAAARSGANPDVAVTSDEAPAVVIVHGLWTGPWAMAWLARRLAAAGMRPFRFGYASVREGLDANADALARFARDIDARELHWLGHSLGGMVIFRALMRIRARPGRVVMLGSPLRGSFAAGRLAQLGIGRRMLGRSVREWFAAPAAEWTLTQELGVIAGTAGLGLGRLVAPRLPSPNDGAVTVAETRLAGTREHLCLPVSHTGMLFSARVADCASRFLRSGSFAATAART